MTPPVTAARAALAAVALVFALSACGEEDKECGAGTVLKGSACVPVKAALVCGAGTVLDGGTCVPVLPDPPDGGCVPSCGARVCGDDGCGGSCGSCSDPKEPVCDTALGRCVGQCVPQCSGRNCGDDGCGASCGECSEGNTCRANGRCVPEAWTCDADWYGGGDACDCNCGTVDSDCSDPGAPVAGCEALEKCSTEGKCTSTVPSGWTCAPSAYGTLDACNCGCGVKDPDCDNDRLAVLGCGPGVTTCNADGTCGTCTADCTGKQCGGDGCGGQCGLCEDANLSACRQGTCVNPCRPVALRCETATCGDDGCGGSCGTCPDGTACTSGRCTRVVPQEAPNSCVGHCGSRAATGCYCTENCAASGLCCQDFEAACHCVPDCAGKECGDDKCNGSCGVCNDPAKKFCGDDQKCTSACTPQCTGRSCGDDGCGGSCGSCGTGESCTFLGQCVPPAWQCDDFLYGDGRGCDCGCGAADKDCAVGNTTVFGCPSPGTKCKADGTCDTTFCQADTACGAGKWCTGVYHQGGARFGGACEAPTASARPPGFTCEVDEECASLVCLGGLCRRYCQKDDECAAAQICLGLPVVDPVTRELRGTAPVCHGLGSGRSCASQATCAEEGERCVAVVDPVTLGPKHVCARSGATSEVGFSCASSSCSEGYLCATLGSARRCTLPCPGGNADCPSGFKCGSVPFSISGLSTPASLPACVPN